MTDILERPLVRAPLATRHADQPIIRALEPLDDGVRLPEHGPETRLRDRAVGVVAHAFAVGRLGVEFVLEVGLRQLAEGVGVEAEEVEHLVEAGDVDGWRSVSWGW